MDDSNMGILDYFNLFGTGFKDTVQVIIKNPIKSITNPESIFKSVQDEVLGDKYTMGYSGYNLSNVLPGLVPGVTKSSYDLINELKGAKDNKALYAVFNKHWDDDISYIFNAERGLYHDQIPTTEHSLRQYFLKPTAELAFIRNGSAASESNRIINSFNVSIPASYQSAFGISKEAVDVLSQMENTLQKYKGNVYQIWNDPKEREIWNKNITDLKRGKYGVLGNPQYGNIPDALYSVLKDLDTFAESMEKINVVNNQVADYGTALPNLKSQLNDVTTVASDVGNSITDVLTNVTGFDKQSLIIYSGIAILAYLLLTKFISKL